MNREGIRMEKKTDSKFIGAGVIAILFSIIGIVDLMTNKNGYWVWFGVGGLSLAYLLYLLNITKGNRNERFEDERKEFISEKSSNMSFNILFVVIAIMQFITERNNIVIKSSLLLSFIIVVAIIIKLGTYLFCKYRY